MKKHNQIHYITSSSIFTIVFTLFLYYVLNTHLEAWKNYNCSQSDTTVTHNVIHSRVMFLCAACSCSMSSVKII